MRCAPAIIPMTRAGTSYATLRLYVLDEANICTHGRAGCCE